MQTHLRLPCLAGFAVLRLGVMALLSASVFGCVFLRSDSYEPELPRVRIDEDLDAIRSASSIQVYLAWSYWLGWQQLQLKDPAAAQRLRRAGSELCHVFGDALRPLLPNAMIDYYLMPPGSSHWECLSRPPGRLPVKDPVVKLHIYFGLYFAEEGTILRENAPFFRPVSEGVIYVGNLWTAPQKPETALEVSAKEGKDFHVLGGLIGGGPLFSDKVNVDVAQLETALLAWANTRAVELANELAAALRAQAAHE